MKKYFSITLIFLLATLRGAAADISLQWKQAVSFYEQKEYDSAAAYFEQIAANKPNEAIVYYNLGNAYYRLNKIAPAVLNYERALKMDPGYKDAKDNLMLAQNRIPNRIAESEDIFFIEWWHSITGAGKATQWAVTALVAFVLIILISFMRRFSPIGRSIPVQVVGVTAFIFACLLVLAFVSASNSYSHNEAVVMESDVPLMSTTQKGKALALIPEGTTVQVLDVKDNWMEVRLPDGRNGWMQQVYITRI